MLEPNLLRRAQTIATNYTMMRAMVLTVVEVILRDMTTLSQNSDLNRMRSALVFFVLTLAGCSSPSVEEVDNIAKPVTQSVSSPGQRQSTNTFAFDIPSLLDKNIDQIEVEFGKPTEADTPNLTMNEMERHYYRKGYSLQIDYDTVSREVTGFIIPAPEKSGGTKNCGKLIAAGNLVRTDPRYSIDSLAMPRDGYYGSIVITAN